LLRPPEGPAPTNSSPKTCRADAGSPACSSTTHSHEPARPERPATRRVLTPAPGHSGPGEAVRPRREPRRPPVSSCSQQHAPKPTRLSPLSPNAPSGTRELGRHVATVRARPCGPCRDAATSSRAADYRRVLPVTDPGRERRIPRTSCRPVARDYRAGWQRTFTSNDECGVIAFGLPPITGSPQPRSLEFPSDWRRRSIIGI
jgi:hypothetical protein